MKQDQRKIEGGWSEAPDVRAEGYEVGVTQGGQASHCPYQRLTAEHSAWMGGYEAGLAARTGGAL